MDALIEKQAEVSIVKRTLVICGLLICMLLNSACSEMCIGAALLGCGSCLSCSTADSYPFMHEADNLDEVIIELVTVAPDEANGQEYSVITASEISDNVGFIEDLNSMKVIIPFGDPSRSISFGNGIRLSYPDGQYELITAHGSALIFEGQHLYNDVNFDSREFDEFWEKWKNLSNESGD